VRIGLRKRNVFADDMAMVVKCDFVYRDAYPRGKVGVYGSLEGRK
jgi:hypothetical protein